MGWGSFCYILKKKLSFSSADILDGGDKDQTEGARAKVI